MTRPQRPVRRQAARDTDTRRTPEQNQVDRQERARRVAQRVRAKRQANQPAQPKDARERSEQLLAAVAEAVSVESKATGTHPQEILLAVARKVAASMPKKQADDNPLQAAGGDIKEDKVQNIDSSPVMTDNAATTPDNTTTVEGDPHGGISEQVLNADTTQTNLESEDFNTKAEMAKATITDVSDIEDLSGGKTNPFPIETTVASADRGDRLFDILAFVERREQLGLSKRATRVAEIARFERMTDEQLGAYKSATEEFAVSPQAQRVARRTPVGRTAGAGNTAVERVPALGQAPLSYSASSADETGDDYLAFLG